MIRRRSLGTAATSAALAVLVGGASVSCGPSTKTLPPVGEVLVILDTDMPVPRMVSRLRIDLYTTDHTWYSSRDLARSKPSDWPTSFGVYLPDEERERDVLVRLRAYPQGQVRDYRGERFEAPTAEGSPFELLPLPPPTEQPRIVSDEPGASTPSTEPLPSLTIDRLLRIRVRPGTRSAARVVLHGLCVGTMTDLQNETTCIDTENQRTLVTEEATTPDLSLPATSLQSTFDFRERCSATPRPPGSSATGPLYDEEVCVDGAMYLFGSEAGFGFSEGSSLTKRVVILPPFRIDRYEVTVGRMRDALAHGFRSTDETPIRNNEPIPRDGTVVTDVRSCTYSATPMGREDYPVTCVTHFAAKKFCEWAGGDLPTEVQWEYVAMDAGRPFKTPFPWGGEPGIAATCDQTVIGRGALPYNNECNKDGQHYGVGSVVEKAGPGGDVSLGLGVVGLAGGVAELMADSFASLGSNCWKKEPLRSPACRATSPNGAVRGGSWSQPSTSVFPARRDSAAMDGYTSEAGFRCVRSGT